MCSSDLIIYQNGFVHLFYQDDYTGNLIYKRGQIDVTAGLENSSLRSIEIVPNPSESGGVNVFNCEKIEAIYSVSGQLIPFEVESSQGGLRLQSSNLKSGIYYIHALNKNGEPSIVKWQVK